MSKLAGRCQRAKSAVTNSFWHASLLATKDVERFRETSRAVSVSLGELVNLKIHDKISENGDIGDRSFYKT